MWASSLNRAGVKTVNITIGAICTKYDFISIVGTYFHIKLENHKAIRLINYFCNITRYIMIFFRV